jgi:hypothetical protein
LEDAEETVSVLNVFRGLHINFKDLVTSLSTKDDYVSYTDLHSSLLTHEFLHKASLQPAIIDPMLPPPTQQLTMFFVQHHSSFSTGRWGNFCGGWRHNNRINYYLGNHGNGSAQNFSTHSYASCQQFGQGNQFFFLFSLTVLIFTYASSNVLCVDKLVKKINKEEEEEELTPAIHSFKAKI